MDWRSMDTAPRDRGWFLAFGEGIGFEDCPFICFWNGTAWQEAYDEMPARPTHWMPLPPPPSPPPEGVK